VNRLTDEPEVAEHPPRDHHAVDHPRLDMPCQGLDILHVAAAEDRDADRIALARRHLDMLCAYHGESRALRIGRKYVAWTIRGCAGAARLRAEVQTMDTRERLDALLDRALAAGPRPEGLFRPVFVSGEG
jgi:hypothetical protein